MEKKQIGFWRCPACNKAWPSPKMAELCQDLDLKEMELQEQYNDRETTPIKRNGNRVTKLK